MNKRAVFYFTEVYPKGYGEAWKTGEINALSNHFETVHVVPFRDCGDPVRLDLKTFPGNVIFHQPLVGEDHQIPQGVNKLYDFCWTKWRITFQLLLELLRNWKVIQSSFENKMKFIYLKQVVYGLDNNKRVHGLFANIRTTDVVYSFWGYGFSNIVPFLRSRIRSKALVSRFHRADLYRSLNNGYIPGQKLLMPILRSALAISNHGLKYLNTEFPAYSRNQYLLRLGAPTHQYFCKSSEDGVFQILSCSRVTKVKRVDLLIKAIEGLDGQIHWTHIGDGDLYEQIRESIPVEQRSRVTFTGFVTSEQVFQYYQNNCVDLFVNVSESEGLPVSIMEAISFGVPILATDVGGTSDIVENGVNGILLPEKLTAEEVTAGIKEIMKLSKDEITSYRNASKTIFMDKVSDERNNRRLAEFLESI